VKPILEEENEETENIEADEYKWRENSGEEEAYIGAIRNWEETSRREMAWNTYL